MGAMDKMARKVNRVKWLCLHLKQICLEVKDVQMKNITCRVLFFKMSSVNIFFTYLSKKYHGRYLCS